MCSVPTTFRATDSASGSGPDQPAATCSSSCVRSAAATQLASGSTGSRTTCRPTIPDIRTFAAANKIELVPTPTYASYLNPVACHCSALTQFVVANANYINWDAFAFALARHVAYRNGDRRLAAAETRHRVAA